MDSEKERIGRVLSFGHLNFGFLLDFGSREKHYFNGRECIGRKDFVAGDMVTFKLGTTRKFWDRETRTVIYRTPAIQVRLISKQGTPVRI